MERHVTIRALDADDGVEIVDAIERRRFALHTPAAVTPRAADTDGFGFPVETAVSITTRRLTVPSVVPIYVRDDDGRLLVEATRPGRETLPAGAYTLDLSGPVKVFVGVTAPVTVEATLHRVTVTFDAETCVLIGARSYHDRPAETVTVSPEPEDVMAAVSLFGSALKTTSPERSFPTLRGHPPAIEVGDALAVPDGLRPAETGVRIECPPALAPVFVAAPLAYYLGARVVPGSTPRLVGDDGLDYPLDRPGASFETEVERVLKRVFLLDCLVRTEGQYAVDLHERRALESRLDLDLAGLYREPMAERLRAYLAVPHDEIAEHVPAWQHATHVAPTPENAEVLPYLVDDLAVIRTPRERPLTGSEVGRTVVQNYRFEAGATRSAAESAGLDVDALVSPARLDSLEQTWFADGIPVGASKGTPAAYRNRLRRTPTTGDVELLVICADPAMAAEGDVVDAVYGSRADLPFEVAVHREPTADELRRLLERGGEFLHFVGHVEDDGVVCTDGTLDLRSLDAVGVDAFFLNGCRSYEQGLALVDAGAVGGIVTVSDVVDASAVALGETVARLVNCGFSLRGGLEVVRQHDLHGANYVTVGDAGVTVGQAESGTPCLLDVRRTERGFEVDVTTHPTRQGGMGSLFAPYFDDADTQYLASGSLEPFAVTEAELRVLLSLEDLPVGVDGDLYWSSDLVLDEV